MSAQIDGLAEKSNLGHRSDDEQDYGPGGGPAGRSTMMCCVW